MLHRLITIITEAYRYFRTSDERESSDPPEQTGTDETDAERRENDSSGRPTDGSDSTDDDEQPDEGGGSTPEGDENNDEEQPEVNRSSEESLDIPWPPFVGSDVCPWPEPPDDPDATIEIRLYWPDEEPWVEQACHQARKYVEYALLASFAAEGYGADVVVHPDPMPAGMDYDEFGSWYWSNDEMAKDANVALKDYGSVYGAGVGYGCWVEPEFFKGWGRDPDSPIKNVGGDGDFDGPTAGIVTILHEIGHCLGYEHLDRVGNEVTKWGEDRTTPMNAGYENQTRTRYVYEYHPMLRQPKVQ
jgi:hypothetical protein